MFLRAGAGGGQVYGGEAGQPGGVQGGGRALPSVHGRGGARAGHQGAALRHQHDGESQHLVIIKHTLQDSTGRSYLPMSLNSAH
eukprot:4285969-Pyramimonas_sp.AAC.1